MKPKPCSMRAFAALWGILLGPLAPVQADGDQAAGRLPGDARVYLGWSRVSADSRLFELAEAVLHSPAVVSAMDEAGAVGRAGFGLVKRVARYSGGLALLPGERADGEPELVLVVDAGEEAAELAAAVRRLIVVAAPEAEVDEQDIQGVALRRLALDREHVLHWGVHRGLFIAASSAHAANELIKSINGDALKLADAAEFKLAMRKIKPAAGGRSLTFFTDLNTVVELLGAAAGPQAAMIGAMWQALGVGDWKSVCVQADRSEYGRRLSAFVHVVGDGGGLATLWKQRALVDADLAVVPKDAYWAQVWNLDVRELWGKALEALSRVAPEVRAGLEQGVELATEKLGFSPVDDLLGAFGDTWALYDAPDHAGFLITGVVLTAEVRDAEALERALARLVEFASPLAAENDIRLERRELKSGKHTVQYVLIGGFPIPIAPAWGFVGDRWVFGLFPQTVLTAMKQADPQTRKGSLLENDDYRVARALLPDDVTSITYSNSRHYHRTMYAVLHMAHTAVAALSAGSEHEYDLSRYPTFADDAAEVRAMVAGYSHDADGLLYTAQGVSPAGLFITGDSGFATTAMLISILLPSLTRARELAKRAVSAANLAGIGIGLHIWANDHEGEFPETLDDLIEEGITTHKQLNSPRDPRGEAAVSYVYIGGQADSADLRNILAYERVTGAEGTSVLFLDAHVEWMKLDAFKRALAETYKRLGRSEELPAELRP